MERLTSDVSHEWHVAINKFSTEKVDTSDWPHFMYEAKSVADEVPRMASMFKQEREGRLRQSHQQCSHSAPEPVADNHLSCALGKRCSECPYLIALDNAKLSPEQIDAAKAWTCATHILMNGGDAAMEGYLLTEDDKMFWQKTYQGMAMSDSG